jgi:hypothetical protein
VKTPSERARPSAGDSTWATLIDGAHDPAKTVRPDDDTLRDADPRPLPGLEGPTLELGRVLGQGGMGVVKLGTQLRLGRDVAVKTLRPDVPRGAAKKLVEEARITGALEHPNIVPVYDVLSDDSGQPMVVLKHLDGTAWEALLYGDCPLPADAAADPLAWHLGVLITVCRAVEFAHDRGIVHRDLKPDNVMIGRFGEVWVLDWGIAVSVRDEAVGLPRARDQRHLVGTPNYLAPEMLGGGASVSTATDVYLLAGILYRVLAGRPPHQGATLHDVLAAVTSMPPLGPSWPRDLRVLLGSSLASDPTARPTVRAFREALSSHLARRDASMLLDSALAGAEHLQDLLRAPDAHERRFEVYDRLGACRFGLREALVRWPEHPEALTALRDALLGAASYEIEAREPRAARVLLADVDEPPPAIFDRLQALEADLDRERRRVHRMREDADLATGFRARVALLMLLCGVWVLLPLALTVAGVPTGYPRALAVDGFQLALTCAATLAASRYILRSQVNRAVLAILVLVPVLSSILMLACWSWALPIELALVLELLVDATLILLGSATVDRRMVPSAAVFLLAFGLGAWAPAWVRPITSIACVLLGLNALVAWGGLGRREGEAGRAVP